MLTPMMRPVHPSFTLTVFTTAVSGLVSFTAAAPADAPLLTRWARDVSPSNALVSYDRAVWKVDADTIRAAATGQLRGDELRNRK